MFIIDLNQILFATLFATPGATEDLSKHLALNVLRATNKKLRKEYGSMVIACDSKINWRREYFPHYKASRRKARKVSTIDWPTVFEQMDQLKSDLKTYFPYKFMEVEGAEADDIIAALVVNKTEDVLIVSSDKDFRQLHFQGVKQYDPINKKFITEPDPVSYLHEHIIRGDVSDGIPNALSPGDVFVTGSRQKPITKKQFARFSDIGSLSEEEHKYYLRNKTLIDLSQIPQELVDQILLEWQKPHPVTDRSLILPYLREEKLRMLMEQVEDF